ncbi:MAG TPA: hypothetical protein VF720_08835 [Candidatus Eisenbacteria bacterium]
MRHRRSAPLGLLTAAALLLLLPAPLPADDAAPTPLDHFGKVLARHRIVLGSHQRVCVAETFYGPGATLDFGLIEGRRHDRLYFRNSRRILQEWTYPGVGLPDSAIAWGKSFANLFTANDTLFVELFQVGDPNWASGQRAVRMEALFQKWIRRAFNQGDWAEAEALGIGAERFKGPPPELVCPLGGG